MTRAIDLTGQVFGRLTVVERVAGSDARWRCCCSCGTKPLAAWSEDAAMKPGTFNKRIRDGWEPAAALRTPVQHHTA